LHIWNLYFLDLLIFCFLHVNYVDACVTLLVYSVLCLVVSPDEGGSLLSKHSALL